MGSGARSLAIATRSLKERGFWVLEVLVFVGRFGLCCLDFALSGMRLKADPWKDQAYRGISTGQLHALLHFHIRPIDVVVYHGSQARPGFEGGFPLRCFQRLSFPYLATRLCRWRDNRSTRGTSIPVLSY